MNPDDKTAKKKFQKIQAAFDVLNDPKKREMYDRYGSSFETMGAGGGPQGSHTRQWSGRPGEAPGGFEDVDFGQFFGDRYGAEQEEGGGFAEFFNRFRGGAGTRPSGRRSRRGTDLTHEISVPFAMAVTGGEMQLSVERPGGRTETITVKVPQGIEEGKKIRLRGQGEPSPGGGAAGDILLTVHVEPHPYFQRKGNNQIVRIPVTLAEAALGAKVDVPTPKGTVAVQIPPGTSSGTKLRVKGHGVATKSGPAGDLLAEVQIVLPKNFDEPTRDLVRQIDQRYRQEPRANLRW
jgi:DnaJ-class molecular chaperone